jgi:hypothetical protein
LTRDELAAVEFAAERSTDRAVLELCDEIYWAFVNYGPQRLTGRHALSREQRRNVARWVLFLRSSEPYEWLPRTKWDELRALFRLQAWHRGGAIEVWPFVSQEQLVQVAARPPFGRPRDRAL